MRDVFATLGRCYGVFTLLKVEFLDIEIRQRTGHCMRRHVTSERENDVLLKSYEAKRPSQKLWKYTWNNSTLCGFLV